MYHASIVAPVTKFESSLALPTIPPPSQIKTTTRIEKEPEKNHADHPSTSFQQHMGELHFLFFFSYLFFSSFFPFGQLHSTIRANVLIHASAHVFIIPTFLCVLLFAQVVVLHPNGGKMCRGKGAGD
jgi:hypothetical protein